MSVSCADLASRIGATVVGDDTVELTHVAPLDRANRHSLSFVNHPRYLRLLAQSQAGAVLIKPEWAPQSPLNNIVCDDPYLCYARAAAILHPRLSTQSGVHPSAVIGDDTVLGDGISIGQLVSIDDNSRLGDRVEIGSGSRIGREVEIGEGTILGANVVIEHGCSIGKQCLVQPGAVIGSDGFGYANDGGQWVHIRQLGQVRIGNNVEIGANTTIDRGAMDDTVIGDGVILDNQIQVAHNVVIGEGTAIAGCVGIAGSAKIGRRCTIGGAATILGHLEITDDVHIKAMSLVVSSISNPGSYASSTPLDESKTWRKNFARMRQLDKLAKRLAALERKFK
ncbi:MAG: UDP-3-O-(3-hydroxymyristoyl)glucosamine N-acyltransferase [Pseudomonadota bacterium]